jgi:phosphoglycolate phosphatase
VKDGRWSDVQAVLFDFDGTLAECSIDFGAMRRDVLALLPQYGCPPIHPDGKYILEVIEEAVQWLSARDQPAAAAFQAAADRVLLDHELDSARRGYLFPGVPECLAALRQAGRKVGVITRNCRAAVQIVLERQPLLYDVLLTRDDVARVKPDPAHPHAALTHLGVPPERAVLVGDHVSDIHCAQDAGMRGIGVLTGSSRDALVEAGADLVLDSAAELADVLL